MLIHQPLDVTKCIQEILSCRLPGVHTLGRQRAFPQQLRVPKTRDVRFFGCSGIFWNLQIATEAGNADVIEVFVALNANSIRLPNSLIDHFSTLRMVLRMFC